MSKSSINLQDQFLNHLRKEKPCNGAFAERIEDYRHYQAFDNFSILVKGESQYLIYKHSVAIIVPKKAIRDFDVRE